MPNHDTASHSRAFRDDYGQPPTLTAKVHHLRSIVQARLTLSERFTLDPDYSEFGRVQFVDGDTGRSYILRSTAAVAIDAAKAQQELFDRRGYITSDIVMLVYSFGGDGLDLSIAGTQQLAGRRHLVASGDPSFIATWPYTPTDGGEPFDQGEPFGDLGDLGWDEDGEEDAQGQ